MIVGVAVIVVSVAVDIRDAVVVVVVGCAFPIDVARILFVSVSVIIIGSVSVIVVAIIVGSVFVLFAIFGSGISVIVVASVTVRRASVLGVTCVFEGFSFSGPTAFVVANTAVGDDFNDVTVVVNISVVAVVVGCFLKVCDISVPVVDIGFGGSIVVTDDDVTAVDCVTSDVDSANDGVDCSDVFKTNGYTEVSVVVEISCLHRQFGTHCPLIH